MAFQSPQPIAEPPTTKELTRPKWWQWLIGALIAVIIWQVAGTVALLTSATAFDVPWDSLDTFPDVEPWIALFIVLITFLPLFIVVPLLYPLLLRLPWKRLITPHASISFRRIWHGFFAMAAIIVPLSAIDLFLNEKDYTFTFDLWTFLPYILVCLVLLPVQTTSEEFLFRGWLLQWNDNGKFPKFLVVIINSSLFALPHMFNPEVKGEYPLAFLYYASAGAMLTLATLRDGSLELAIGAHFANNLLAGTLVSYQDAALPSAALFLTGELEWVWSTVISFAIIPLFLWLTRTRKDPINAPFGTY